MGIIKEGWSEQKVTYLEECDSLMQEEKVVEKYMQLTHVKSEQAMESTKVWVANTIEAFESMPHLKAMDIKCKGLSPRFG
jgi:hypothetical protein